jgi:hypothetical protein
MIAIAIAIAIGIGFAIEIEIDSDPDSDSDLDFAHLTNKKMSKPQWWAVPTRSRQAAVIPQSQMWALALVSGKWVITIMELG